MINIQRKEDCVGCNACVQRCPKQCISMSEDEQGFLYPHVDVSKCIECGLCEKVCPVINQYDAKTPEKVYAAWNTDDAVRLSSSSGGIFYALAKRIIEEGGVVFGARFNDKWEVIHAYSETLDGIKAFQGSKYVQSKIGQSYLNAERFLKSERKVLFSGTPCQIVGLKRFLRKDYEGLLLTVDVVCHGVPSPGIWKEYLNSITRPKGASKNTESHPYPKSVDGMSSIEDISFRDKRLGWEKYGIAIRYAPPKGGQNSESQSAISKRDNTAEIFESHREDLYMQGFLKDLYLRPSCYTCPAKCGKSHSDITLADFWGIRNHYPNLYSEKGVSLVLINSKLGTYCLNNMAFDAHQVSYEVALRGNRSIERSSVKPKICEPFWYHYKKEKLSAISWALLKLKPSLLKHYYNRFLHIVGFLKKSIM